MSADYLIPTPALGHQARRIVSEDSIHSIASLSATIHPFPESQNLAVVSVAHYVRGKEHDSLSPQPVVLCLLSQHGKAVKEWHNSAGEITKAVDLPIPAVVATPSQRTAAEPCPEIVPGARSCWETLKAAESLKLRR
jgi:hypothetical protein